MRVVGFLLMVTLLFSCNKKKKFDGPNSFADGFENYSNANELIDGGNVLWSFFQVTNDNNTITIDTNIVHSGNQSIRFYGDAGNVELSKCSINKQFMAFWEGETVVSDFWCYLEGNKDANWLFIFDLEEKVPIGAGPGMRLAIVENQFLVEHKFPNPNLVQDGEGILFPRDQWVNIRFETKLSRKKKGSVRVWQNNQLIIEQEDWKTLPKDLLYAQQGTKGMYSQIEYGLTANGSDKEYVMYFDDVNVQTIP